MEKTMGMSILWKTFLQLRKIDYLMLVMLLLHAMTTNGDAHKVGIKVGA